jgi:hypothetical protein
MHHHDLTQVDLTLRQVATRDLDTDEESTAWQVEHENMDGVIREDTAKEALEVFAACLETDNEDARIDLEDLETEPQPLA